MKQIQSRPYFGSASATAVAKGSILLVAMLVSLSSLEAYASCGTFGIVKGDIKIESGSTHKIEDAAAGAKICSGDTVIAGKDSRAKILINDGAPSGKNELNISPDTRLVLEKYEFNASDNKKKVMLNILSGKVRATTTPNFYNDKANDGQANTFEVRTKSAVAGVRGTDFMTSFDPATSKSETVTFSGKVMFGQPGPNGTIANAVQVLPGSKSEVKPGSPPSTPQAVPAAEMKKLDKESKADTASTSTASTGPGSGKKKGDGTASSSDRAPASTSNSGASSSGGATGGSAGSSAGGSTGSSIGGSMGGSMGSGSTSGPMSSSSMAAAPAAPPSSIGSGMVDSSDLGGGAILGPATPSGQSSSSALTGSLPVVPATTTAPAVPKCDFCTQAVQNTQSKVNVIIHLPSN